MHIGILGGGFTGCLLAVHLLRRARPGMAVTIIERALALGRGAAYGTDDPEHLLNVRAGNMGAFPDDPRHFHGWLTARFGADAPAAAAFVSRRLYGEYVGEILDKALAAAAGAVAVSRVTALATELHAGPRPAVELADGRRLAFDRLALCFGNLPPAEIPGLGDAGRASGRYLHDPWRAHELARIGRGDTVLIVGSGLTMADVVQSLASRDHAGMIHVVSRHGLLPQRHADPRPMALEIPPLPLRALLRWLRAEAEAAPGKDHDWRDVVDALRAVTGRVWAGMADADRRRFLRHLRARWDVHRHRLAPAVADVVERLARAGRLNVTAARLESIAWNRGRFDVAVRPRGADRTVNIAANWIVNCTGPRTDYAACDDPLLRGAVRSGTLRPDALRLGLDVAGDGAVIDAKGTASPTIFAVGPPTRGAFWEVVAVPDIRRECARMADVLLRS